MVRAWQPWWLRPLLCASYFLAILDTVVLANDENWTTKHEEGRCALRGQCGKQSFFGGQLPCPDNGLAQQPEKDTRAKLVAVCGEPWADGAICCDDDQVSNKYRQYLNYVSRSLRLDQRIE